MEDYDCLLHRIQQYCPPKTKLLEHTMSFNGCWVTLAPNRFALVRKEDLAIEVEGPSADKKTWASALAGLIQNATEELHKGGGTDFLGILLRKEIENRKEGVVKDPKEFIHWWEWLSEEDLALLMGCCQGPPLAHNANHHFSMSNQKFEYDFAHDPMGGLVSSNRGT